MKALLRILDSLGRMCVLLLALAALGFVLFATICAAPLLMALDWRDRRKGVPEFRPEIMR